MTAKRNYPYVEYNKSSDNYEGVIAYRKRYSYSLQKYGPLAKLLAEKSIKHNERFKNYIEDCGDYAIMKIWSATKRQVFDVFLDTEDVDKIKDIKWFIETPENSRTYYAAADKIGKLHRFILKLPKGEGIVDHINRNGLDDRKENLRIVTNSVNKRNSDPRETNEFGHNGISKEVAPSGLIYYRASWMEDDGKVHSRKFSSKKYPNALELAIKTRIEKERELGYVS